MRACRPFLTPMHSAIIYAVLAAVCLAMALGHTLIGKTMFELRVAYSGSGNLTFHIPYMFTGQLFVYYELGGIHQNNYLYAPSLSRPQLRGKDENEETELASCRPRTRSSGRVIVPCGALPGSVFNDTFEFSSDFPALTRRGISLPQFRSHFTAPAAKYNNVNTSYQWLNEPGYRDLFPDGQRDERFINWLRVAGFSPFRKLWAKTDDIVTIEPGMYSVEIESNFPVDAFDGSKALIFADVAWLGGKNSFTGQFFFGLTGFAVAAAIGLAIAGCLDWFPLYKHMALARLAGPGVSPLTQSLVP
jgi:hypothetical protein